MVRGIARLGLAVLLTLSGVATGTSGDREVLASAPQRLGGDDRFATAVAVAEQVGGGSLSGLQRLIVVTGTSAVDALVAGGLAGYFDRCPRLDGGACGRTAILLTQPDELPRVTADALLASGLSAQHVVVIGGTRAVTEEVRTQIALATRWHGRGANPIVRLAGDDRYATAQAVADYVRTQAELSGEALPDSFRTPLVVPGDPIGDALTSGAVAYRDGRLIAFSRISTWGGDPMAVPGVTRVVLASGESPTDAPVAATLGRQAVVVLTEPHDLGDPAARWFEQRRGRISGLTVIGGTSAVSNTAERSALSISAPPVVFLPPPAIAVNYGATMFTTGQASEVIAPTVTGGSGSPTFSVSGALPAGVTFSTTTGAFTGPATWGVEATQIAAGGFHSCAATVDGRALCWGSVGSGRLGNGSTDNNATPGAVVRPGSVTLTGVTQVVAGQQHSCALLATGTVTCWGAGASGQIGRGTTLDSWTAIDVVLSVGGPSLSGVTQIAAGSLHTCAVRLDSTVACWGSNGSGRLGDGTTTTPRNSPVDVLVSPLGPSLSGVTAIAAGLAHTCALMADTTVQCWGQGGSGQLGDGRGVDSSSPVTVSGLTGVTQLAAGGGFTCAVRNDTTVACWGTNSWGRLGDGTNSNRTTPVDVLVTLGGPALSGVTQVSTGDSHACARLNSGAVYCWGAGGHGRLGNGTTATQLSPVAVTDTSTATLSAVSQVSAGSNHSCAITSENVPLCWGRDSGGQLGDGTITPDRERADAVTVFTANAGWPATVTVTASDATGSTSVTVVLTRS